jgi:hypothetical protein
LWVVALINFCVVAVAVAVAVAVVASVASVAATAATTAARTRSDAGAGCSDSYDPFPDCDGVPVQSFFCALIVLLLSVP